MSARFWLIITKVERKIASSETMIVSRPNWIMLDAQPDPTGEPDDVDVDERHRTGECGDRVRNPVLGELLSLRGMFEERRVDRLRWPHRQDPPVQRASWGSVTGGRCVFGCGVGCHCRIISRPPHQRPPTRRATSFATGCPESSPPGRPPGGFRPLQSACDGRGRSASVPTARRCSRTCRGRRRRVAWPPSRCTRPGSRSLYGSSATRGRNTIWSGSLLPVTTSPPT